MNIRRLKNNKGITLIEVLVATAIFLMFALGIYGGINLVFKIVYSSRLQILENAILSEKLETVRNLPFADVGIVSGVPSGVLVRNTTTTRNGIIFDIETTVRNIDDPFDGLTPADNWPADYKLVEISAICQNCFQKNPVVLSTRVSPRNLEGNEDYGSLFIHVFDKNGLDIVGANIHIENNEINPSVIIDDVTDINGMRRIIGTPTATLSYEITVGKSGYSSDYTVSPSVGNPNPTKQPLTVMAQAVTEISFSIDLSGILDINTISPACLPLPDSAFNIRGEKKIGNNPIVYKYEQDLTTDWSGNENLTNMEWDTYYLNTSGTPYDVAGFLSSFPINLTPGATQAVTMVLEPHTTNSLLVLVRDASTKEALSSSTISLTGPQSRTITTDVGFQRQTDWSGGGNQQNYDIEDQFYLSQNIDYNSPAGNIELEKFGGDYLSPGWLESSTFDMGTNANYHNIILQPITQPASTTLRIQLATATSTSPSQWNFVGPDGIAPDGSNNSYYTSTNTLIYGGHDNERYLRYKVFLDTTDSKSTPELQEILFTYTNACTPPGQAFFSNLNSGTYTIEVSKDGYATINDPDFAILGNEELVIDMSAL